MTPTISLTKEQIDHFHREGYLAIDRLTTTEDVAALRKSYDRIFAAQAGRQVGDEFDLAGTDEDDKPAVLPQILNPSRYAPEMNNCLLLVNATHIAKQLLGNNATCEIAHAILKPAATGAETPWHQDAAYWDPSFIYNSISIWVPLQEATRENGCMEFVPGSHRLDVLSHRHLNNDPRIHALELTSEDVNHVSKHVSCPLPPGGATVHGAYMLHHTGPNKSSIPRRALILKAEIPPVKRSSPRTFRWQIETATNREKRARTQTSS